MGLFEIKHELEKTKEREKELGFRAQKALDYFEQVVSLSQKECKDMFVALEKLEIPRLKAQHLYKIVDVMPATAKDVKTVLQGYALTITNDNLDKIAKTIAEFVQKK